MIPMLIYTLTFKWGNWYIVMLATAIFIHGRSRYHFLTQIMSLWNNSSWKNFHKFKLGTKITRVIGPLPWFKNVCDKIAQIRQFGSLIWLEKFEIFLNHKKSSICTNSCIWNEAHNNSLPISFAVSIACLPTVFVLDLQDRE